MPICASIREGKSWIMIGGAVSPATTSLIAIAITSNTKSKCSYLHSFVVEIDFRVGLSLSNKCLEVYNLAVRSSE